MTDPPDALERDHAGPDHNGDERSRTNSQSDQPEPSRSGDERSREEPAGPRAPASVGERRRRPADPEKNWRLRRRIGVTSAALAGVFTVLIVAVVVSTIFFVNAANAVIYRWQPAVVHTEQLLTDLVDQETGVRGYALSHDEAYLAPYRRYRGAARSDRATLHRLIGADGALRPDLTALGKSVRRWQRDVAQPAIRGIRAGDPAAIELVEGSRAKALFDGVRTRAAALSAAVDARAQQARASRATAGTFFVVALALAVLLVVLAALFLWRGLHRWVLGPIDRLAARTREVASGARRRSIAADGPAELTALGRDVEGMRRQIVAELAHAEEITEELRLRGEELARSNEDLQQFAYVASHDLSEPLRKVANFCQLLERQYGPQLDDRARQYIDFAVDGARRMQALITDLLALSRVGRATEEFVPVDLDEALDQALANLADRVAEADARIERATALPTVFGDRLLLVSLLENLVGNAVKYRQPDAPPTVRIAACHDPLAALWTVTVVDNGIGIEEQYAERIFAVFQRLHLRDQYGGTGIGLALCRRIVEFHGGHIRLAPVQSQHGATFEFTVPEGGPNAQARD